MWRIQILLIIVLASIADAGPNECPTGQHWVKDHHRRAYTRADGTQVAAADVKAHCRKNPAGFHVWVQKLRDERPKNWRLPKEQATRWTTEEIERVLEALDETAPILRNQDIDGIYRMKSSETPENPGSSHGANIVLYDAAFESNHVLADVLGHELAHRLFLGLSEAERASFRRAGKWARNRGGGYSHKRPSSTFLRENAMLSPEEDFADSVTSYFHRPEQLKKVAPSVYAWMEKTFKSKNKGSK